MGRKLSNRGLYSLLALTIIILLGASVYALTAGGTGDPGHNIDSIGAPAGCNSGEALKWTGTSWACATESLTIPSCTSNQVLSWVSGSWQCVDFSNSPSPFCENIYGGDCFGETVVFSDGFHGISGKFLTSEHAWGCSGASIPEVELGSTATDSTFITEVDGLEFTQKIIAESCTGDVAADLCGDNWYLPTPAQLRSILLACSPGTACGNTLGYPASCGTDQCDIWTSAAREGYSNLNSWFYKWYKLPDTATENPKAYHTTRTTLKNVLCIRNF